MPIEKTSRDQVRWLCAGAMLMALNVAASSFGIPLPTGRFYLNDIVINVAAILLDPADALIVGGFGAFLGDFFFYPAPMFVTLIVRGLQAWTVSMASHRLPRHPVAASAIGAALGATVSVTGYTIGRTFFYGDRAFAVALAKLPNELVMAFGGGAIALLLCWRMGLEKLFHKCIHI